MNADDIAAGMSGTNPPASAMAAGRIMLARIRALAEQRANFAFETTLASRSFAPWLADLKRDRYRVDLVFLWLPSAELAIRRVGERVAHGGHDVPEGTVRRRYRAGLRNFFGLYEPLSSSWRFYDASGEDPRLVASRMDLGRIQVYDGTSWTLVQKQRDT